MRWIVGLSRAVVAAALFSILCLSSALAQGVTTGAISGKVTDAQGQPVAEAAVQVTHRGTGFTTSVRTRANGQYLVQGLAASGAGAYNRYNTITVDGANQSERFNLGATGGVPGGSAGGKIISLDAVKEFRVLFTPTDVRQGSFAGMLVNAVTKNGTNEFHGGASYTYRSNEDVAGFDLVGQDLRAAKFDVKQYAFYVGGPIIRDRLHFFVAPEFQHRTQPATGPYYLNGQGFNSPAVELDSLTRIANFMKTNYAFDVGSTGPVDIDNPLTNLFGRVDFQISPTHRLVVREIGRASCRER